MRPITLYDSDRLRVRLAAFLDISRTALRAVAPIVDLLVRLSLAKAFIAPGMLPGGDIGDFHATWPIIAARVTGPVLLAAGFFAGGRESHGAAELRGHDRHRFREVALLVHTDHRCGDPRYHAPIPASREPGGSAPQLLPQLTRSFDAT